MTEKEAYDRLTELFHEVFGREDIVLQPKMTANDVKGWDSFTHLNLIVGVEMRFGIRIHTSEIENLQNVGDLVAVILARTN
jgi:acyl carrier protein